ncbi:transcriptional regulator, XRE family [Candidatus Koribacter versatilis Ellin345]|uniref:Transcriptional regulator, XRE family n=1 Tax=Koribacter versatilis (strain Ellin345) TaxID=204669 RepID=Q1IRT4_KORVE|nr:helix-turn-helix transcriptional regulator [Candidatus Koribacter versatilis]ABF40416.1 transcriptional regulator, XRE family [Candidatus Koribacter versatilis Ellin345]
MATTLAPVDSREVVRCDKCTLVQFRTTNNLCRKCRQSLDPEEPEQVIAPPQPAVHVPSHSSHSQLQIAQSIRNLRQRAGLSQRQLALRMQVPRTYVSKIENEKATPTLSSLERLAKALQVTLPDLLTGGQPSREEQVRDLMSDSFLAELMPICQQLNGLQLNSILNQVREITMRPRRTA